MMERFKAWVRQPFSADMSALDWFLFMGLLILISALWQIIFAHIRGNSQ